MKRFLSILFLVFVTFVSYGQNVESEKHLEFMGVEIDGKLKDFVSKFKKKGFKLVSIDETSATMEGKFTGEDVKIFVYSTPKTKTVHTVAVNYANLVFVTWDLLETKYMSMKNILKKKYGEPFFEKEEFLDSNVEGSSEKLYELKEGRCEYKSYFSDNVEVGYIAIEIMSMSSPIDPCVGIFYLDVKNNKLREAENLSDI